MCSYNSESIAWSVLTTNSKCYDSREVIGEEILSNRGDRRERGREEGRQQKGEREVGRDERGREERERKRGGRRGMEGEREGREGMKRRDNYYCICSGSIMYCSI